MNDFARMLHIYYLMFASYGRLCIHCLQGFCVSWQRWEMNLWTFVFNAFLYFGLDITHNTGWPKKNATTLIVNFKNIINKMELIFCFIMWKTNFSNKMTPCIINFGVRWVIDPSAILVRQCHFQTLVTFFDPIVLWNTNKILTSRSPVALTEHLLWKRRQCEHKRSYSLRKQLILRDAVKRKILAIPRIARVEKVAKCGKTTLPR